MRSPRSSVHTARPTLTPAPSSNVIASPRKPRLAPPDVTVRTTAPDRWAVEAAVPDLGRQRPAAARWRSSCPRSPATPSGGWACSRADGIVTPVRANATTTTSDGSAVFMADCSSPTSRSPARSSRGPCSRPATAGCDRRRAGVGLDERLEGRSGLAPPAESPPTCRRSDRTPSTSRRRAVRQGLQLLAWRAAVSARSSILSFSSASPSFSSRLVDGRAQAGDRRPEFLVAHPPGRPARRVRPPVDVIAPGRAGRGGCDGESPTGPPRPLVSGPNASLASSAFACARTARDFPGGVARRRPVRARQPGSRHPEAVQRGREIGVLPGASCHGRPHAGRQAADEAVQRLLDLLHLLTDLQVLDADRRLGRRDGCRNRDEGRADRRRAWATRCLLRSAAPAPSSRPGRAPSRSAPRTGSSARG